MNHDFRSRTNFCVRALFVALACFSLSVHATPVAAPNAFDRFMGLATGAGKTTVTLASDGTPLAAPGVPTIEADGGLPKATATGSVVNPAGNRVPVTGVARVPAAEVAKAVGRAGVGLAKNAAVWIGVGTTLYTLGKELNFILSRNPDGSVGVQKPDPAACTALPCWEYSGAYPDGSRIWTRSHAAACQAYTSYSSSISVNYNISYLSSTPRTASTSATCVQALYAKTNGAFVANQPVSLASRDATVQTPEMVPSTMQELIDAVAAKSGWPSTSVIGQVLEESAAQSGVKVKTGTMTVTGPATSPGTQTVTQNTTNNTTKTETTTHGHTYSGDTITTTTVTVTNITNTTTGDVISNETKTETPPKEETPPDDVCKSYPDRVGCAELGEEQETPMPKKTENITFTPVIFQSNASCPPPLSITGTLPVAGSFAYPLPYTGLCNGAGIIRAFLLMAAVLVGIGIFVGGLKS